MRQPEGLARAVELAESVARANELAQKADSDNTRRAYEHDIEQWKAFVARHSAMRPQPEPFQLVLGLIGELDAVGASVPKIKRRLAAISRLYRDAGQPSPTAHPQVRLAMAGLVRERDVSSKKRPITGDMIARAFDNPEFTFDPAERALICVGLVAGMRRSEIVDLRVGDIEEFPDGLVLKIRKSKTDKKKKGAVVGVPYGPEVDMCPARLLKAHLRKLETLAGARPSMRVFAVVGDTVNNLVKRVAKAAGENPKDFGAHSLRAGMMTEATASGVALAEAMSAGRWKSADVARGYARSEALQNKAHLAVADSLRRKKT